MSIPFAMWVDLASLGPRGLWAIEGASIGRIAPRDTLVIRGASGAEVRTKVRTVTSVPRGAEEHPPGVVIDPIDQLLPASLTGGVATEPGLLLQAFWARTSSRRRCAVGATFELDDGVAHGLYGERDGVAVMIVLGGLRPEFAHSVRGARLSDGTIIAKDAIGSIYPGWAVHCSPPLYERAGETVRLTAPSGPAALDAPVELVDASRVSSGRILSQQRDGRLQVQSGASGGANVVIGPAVAMAA